MSANSVESILSRAMSDAGFADQLFANPDQALTGFDLTAEEVGNLKALSRAEFDRVAASSPEERKSFGLTTNYNQTALNIRK